MPLSFDIATISSASEGGSRSDEGIILSPRRWLTDEVISAAQMQFYPSMAGLQPPVLQKVFAFQVRSLSKLCMSGTIRVYYSLYKTVKGSGAPDSKHGI